MFINFLPGRSCRWINPITSCIKLSSCSRFVCFYCWLLFFSCLLMKLNKDALYPHRTKINPRLAGSAAELGVRRLARKCGEKKKIWRKWLWRSPCHWDGSMMEMWCRGPDTRNPRAESCSRHGWLWGHHDVSRLSDIRGLHVRTSAILLGSCCSVGCPSSESLNHYILLNMYVLAPYEYWEIWIQEHTIYFFKCKDEVWNPTGQLEVVHLV